MGSAAAPQIELGYLAEWCAAQGRPLSEAQLGLFRAYYALLLDWNARLNLTRLTSPEDVVIRHFVDSLTGLLVMGEPGALLVGSLADVGSGAGFPGLPLKFVCPELRVTLVESVGKKAEFLRHVVGELGLEGVDVVTARAEDIGQRPEHRQRYDWAVARAVGPLAVLAEYLLPLVRIGGRAVAYKTAGSPDELEAARHAVRLQGGRIAAEREVRLPGLDKPRLLVALDKVSGTPRQFPRRAGAPARKLIG